MRPGDHLDADTRIVIHAMPVRRADRREGKPWTRNEKYSYDPNEPDVDLAEIGMTDADVQQFVREGRRAVGRPTLSPTGAASERIAFRITAEEKGRMSAIAARDGLKESAAYRRAVQAYLGSDSAGQLPTR